MLFHLVDGEQAVFFDRFDDSTLAHAIAATDFGSVGHGGCAVFTRVAGIAEVGTGKGAAHEQLLTHLADVLAILH